MAEISRYVIIGVSVIMVLSVFVTFSDQESGMDYTGIAHDVTQTKSGYVFELLVDGRYDLRCFAHTSPIDLGYYGVTGSMSDDDSIFFASDIHYLDSR